MFFTEKKRDAATECFKKKNASSKTVVLIHFTGFDRLLNKHLSNKERIAIRIWQKPMKLLMPLYS
jgi:hypothetical protein